jgi:hypothetical protein
MLYAANLLKYKCIDLQKGVNWQLYHENYQQFTLRHIWQILAMKVQTGFSENGLSQPAIDHQFPY